MRAFERQHRNERATYQRFDVDLENSARNVGRFCYVPGKGQRINKWRRVMRAIVRVLT